MPTPEEIKKIAEKFAKYKISKQDPKAFKELQQLMIPGIASVVTEWLEWLSKEYCIVPKSKLKEEYRINQGSIIVSTHIHEPDLIENFKGRNEQLETLFGSSLFNEEE